MFSTAESAQYELAYSVQSESLPPAPFLRDKLFVSILNSLKGLPDAYQSAAALTDTVIAHIVFEKNALVQRDHLVELTSLTLKRFDKRAYLRYSAEYLTS